MYDAWKCASPEEGVEVEERWDDVTSVEECAHGEHPLECSLCTSAGLHAAVSGEGDDMTEDQQQEVTIAVEMMRTVELVALRYQIESELKKRAENYEREAKAARMALDGIKPRKTRSDAGTTRARKVEAA
jgi:hypothetical protein